MSLEVTQGFIQSGLKILQGLRAHNLLWITSFSTWVSSWWKSFSSHLVWTSLVSTSACCLVFSHTAPLRSARLHLPEDLVTGRGMLLLGPPNTVSSWGWTSPAPSSSLHRASAPAPWLWPSTELTPVYHCLPCFPGPKTEHSIQMWSNKCWVNGNNHFPPPTDCTPVAAAQDAVGLPCCQDTLLDAAQPDVQEPSRSLSQTCSLCSQPVLLHRVPPSQAKGLAFVLAEFLLTSLING